MAEDTFMGALQRGYGLSRILDDMNRRSHDREVNGRIDEILAASNGGTTDLSTLDPKYFSDRIGMEAMGKVTEQLSQTTGYQQKIFENSMNHAQDLWKLSQQYMTDFRTALGDQEKGIPANEPRARAILGTMINQLNVPYRVVQEGDGYRVYHVTPEGEKDMGNMSMLDLYNRIKDTVSNQDTFIKGSMAYGMTNAEQNTKYFSDTSKWRLGITKDGKQLAMVPQMFERNGQLVGGFYVEGLGNRTLQELADAGITVGGVTGAGLARQYARGVGSRGRGLGGGDGSSDGEGGEQVQGQPNTDASGRIQVPEKVMKDLRSLADKNSKDKENGTDLEHSQFFEQMYANALAIAKKTNGKMISPRDFMAFMQQQRKEFNAENAGKLEGMTDAEKNKAFRDWYEGKFAAAASLLRSGKKNEQSAQTDQQAAQPQSEAPAAANKPQVSEVRQKQNASLISKAQTARPKQEKPTYGRDKKDPKIDDAGSDAVRKEVVNRFNTTGNSLLQSGKQR